MTCEAVKELADQIRGGSIRALARGLTWIESGGARAEALSDALFSYTGNSHVVGVTGAAGSGKSTLVRALTQAARARGKTVAVIAVDPSSPFSGGSILGDRIRMTDLASDPGVFIRSMATRGALGGLCAAAGDAIDLMSAAGRDLVLVETVGIGQDEVDVVRMAHTTVVVSVPGLGDDIQTLKAGILEIADVHVVNKADRDGANRTIGELQSALTLDSSMPDGWRPPVLACIATREEGTSAVLDTIEQHLAYLRSSGEFVRRQRLIAQSRVVKLAQQFVAETLHDPIDKRAEAAAVMIDRVINRELSPYQAARRLLTRVSA